ncbi:polysaccharide biosynthesis/export family protein [Flexibacterium corallicola]|uniref:polysaccharide biosynthesis/export family protein n=1 Tax=Flexibacterium corallicola TaxID=3037259 RepID=UPI00286F3986|nr:polysaccharide biosynthesis/export family protein [Pseudovibrio sp. M1P-2-3]
MLRTLCPTFFNRSGSFKAGLTLVASALLLGSCQIMPASGPISSEIVHQSSEVREDTFDYTLIDVNSDVIAALHAYSPIGLGKRFSAKRFAPRHMVGVGDVVSVVVWEQGADRLFSNATGSRTELGPFMVSQKGTITVPYIGRVNAAGQSLDRLQDAIQAALEGQATDPQVIVTLKDNQSSLVVVNGDVRSPGQYPLSLQGERLLDVVAKAGGNATKASETFVTLDRQNARGKQLLKTVFEDGSENVYVRPGDRVYVSHDPQTFTAFGAVSKVGEYPLQVGEVSLVEALGRIGGLSDNRADTKGLFVFRYEDAKVLRALGIEGVSEFDHQVPVIYRVNMRQAQSYFKGQQFNIKDKDVLYVANSYTAELGKFLGIIGRTVGVARSTSSLSF